MARGTPDRTWREAVGTPDVHGADAEILTEAEHAALVHIVDAADVTVDPSGLLVVTTSDVQAALGELDAAVRTISTAAATTGSVGSASEANVTCTLVPAQPDTDYKATADVIQDSGGEALRVRRIRTLSATEVLVNVQNNAITSQTGVVHVIAVHD